MSRKPVFEVTRETRYPDRSSCYRVERETPGGIYTYQIPRDIEGQLDLNGGMVGHRLSTLERRCIRAAIERWMREWGQV